MIFTINMPKNGLAHRPCVHSLTRGSKTSKHDREKSGCTQLEHGNTGHQDREQTCWAQSVDHAVQSVDPYVAQESMDRAG